MISVIGCVDVVGSASLSFVVEVFIQFAAIRTEVAVKCGLLTADAKRPPGAIDQTGIFITASAEHHVFAWEQLNVVAVASDLLRSLAYDASSIVTLDGDSFVGLVAASSDVATLFKDLFEEANACRHGAVRVSDVAYRAVRDFVGNAHHSFVLCFRHKKK